MDLIKISNHKSSSKTSKKNIMITPKKYAIDTPSTISKDKALVRLKIKNLLEEGRTEISTIEELSEFPIGSIVSYISGKSFFPGGTITWIGKKSFVYRKLDIDPKIKYRVYLKHTDKIFIIDTPITKTTRKATKYPVKIGSVVVYYAKDSFDVKRYMNTNKYLFMSLWFEKFH